MNFSVTILGCGSAIPTIRHNPSSQLVNVSEKYLLLDCGEGTQLQLQKYGAKIQKIEHILISHLHGDHFFGLVGLLSTMQLLGRQKHINIHSPSKYLEDIIHLQLNSSNSKLNFDINISTHNENVSSKIIDDKLFEVHTIPMEHRIPCTGYLVMEKKRKRKIDPEKIKQYNIPVAYMKNLQHGEDINVNNRVIKNKDITFAPLRSRQYAYCTDTKYSEPIIDIIKNSDVLYHETTFLEKDVKRAEETFHSTSNQAAMIAKKASVGKLFIGHYSSRYQKRHLFEQEARKVFANTYSLKEGDVIDITF